MVLKLLKNVKIGLIFIRKMGSQISRKMVQIPHSVLEVLGKFTRSLTFSQKVMKLSPKRRKLKLVRHI